MMGLPISLGRFAAVWLAMAVAMSANGIFRELVLKRAVSDRMAGVISAALGVAIIALITRVGFGGLGQTVPVAQLATLSVALVVATVTFETVLGRVVDHKSWSELAAHYALWRGELWPIVLAFLAVTPFLWARWLPRPGSLDGPIS